MRQPAGVEILPQHGFDGFVSDKIRGGAGWWRGCFHVHSFTPKRSPIEARIARCTSSTEPAAPITTQRVGSEAGKAAQYNALRREVETLRQMYQSLLMQANQAGMSSSVPINPIRIVEPANPPDAPYKPQPVLNLSLGTMFGIALAAGLGEKLPAEPDSGVEPAHDHEESPLEETTAGPPCRPGAALPGITGILALWRVVVP